MSLTGMSLLALRAWLFFEIESEHYDRTLPGGWSTIDRDCWIPAGNYASASAHARELASRVRDYLMRRVGHCGSNEHSYVSGLSYATQVRLAKELDAERGGRFEPFPLLIWEPEERVSL